MYASLRLSDVHIAASLLCEESDMYQTVKWFR